VTYFAFASFRDHLAYNSAVFNESVGTAYDLSGGILVATSSHLYLVVSLSGDFTETLLKQTRFKGKMNKLLEKYKEYIKAKYNFPVFPRPPLVN